MSEHAKSIWEAKPPKPSLKDQQVWQSDILAGGLRIATVNGVGESSCEANSKVIQASPQMYEAIIVASGRIQKIMDRHVVGSKDWVALQQILFGLFASLPDGSVKARDVHKVGALPPEAA